MQEDSTIMEDAPPADHSVDNGGDSTYPAPYGRACEECAHAKCKCMLRREGGRCERFALRDSLRLSHCSDGLIRLDVTAWASPAIHLQDAVAATTV